MPLFNPDIDLSSSEDEDESFVRVEKRNIRKYCLIYVEGKMMELNVVSPSYHPSLLSPCVIFLESCSRRVLFCPLLRVSVCPSAYVHAQLHASHATYYIYIFMSECLEGCPFLLYPQSYHTILIILRRCPRYLLSLSPCIASHSPTF